MAASKTRRSATGLPAVVTRIEHVMGTVVSITVPRGSVPAARIHAVIDRACAGLHWVDATFSTWDPGSAVSRLRRAEAKLADLPAEVSAVLALCRTARAASRGWFDPWALPGGLDPTGLVKGWAVQRAADTLREAGLPAAIVNGGGDIAVFGSPEAGQSWRIGIRHPWRPNALAGIIEIEAAMATSASYERGSHLIDPATGRPTSRAASATVTGPDLALADALATAVAVGGDDALAAVAAMPGYAGYLIRPDGSEATTSGITFAS